jgi:adenylate cyclase
VKHHVKRKAKIIRQYAIGWPLGLMAFVIFRSVGTTEEGSFDPSLSESIALAGGIGLLFGVISGLFQYQIEEKHYRKASLRKIAFLKLIYLVFFVMLMIIFAFFTTNLLFDHQTTLREFAFDAGSGIIYLYVILYDTFMFMLRQINLMLGEGNLKRMFMGEFYEPHEEEHVFMFIDLQSSTQIAEELGHIKYSQLLQDCFNDLGVTSKYYAQIYQYVGDEAVLTWSLDRAFKARTAWMPFMLLSSRSLIEAVITR